MTYPDRAKPVWFGRERQNDSLCLHAWRDSPLTYFPRQEIAPGWSVDHYELFLGQDESGELFRRAAEITLNNRFYPPDVMTVTADYLLEHRPVQVGDRVVQRILVLRVGNQPLLEVLTMNEVTEVIQEGRRAGFTYTTTASHSEVGEWSPVVEWRENGEVVLVIDVISTMRPGTSDFGRRFTRRLQLRAHQRSIQNFKALLLGLPVYAPARRNAIPFDLLPVGMLALAFALFVWAVASFFKRAD